MPRHHQFKHPISSISAPLRYVNQRSIDLDQCLIGTGISYENLNDRKSTINLKQLLRLCRNIKNLSGDRYLGLEIGKEIHVADYGMFGFAMMSATTLRQAIELGMRLIALSFTGFQHELIENGRVLIHRMTPLMDYGDLLNVMSDRELSAVYLVYQELTREKPPIIEINFVHYGGGTPSRYSQHFGCPVNFGCPFNEIVFPADYLDRTISDTSLESSELCVQQCELLISKLREKSSPVEDVRYEILSRPAYFPGIEIVAKKMHMSSRTLRRHLEKHGTSYQDLLNEIRLDLAREYLLSTTLRLDQIAQLLGYTEPGNFTHAFKRWTGVSPRAYRMQRYKHSHQEQ